MTNGMIHYMEIEQELLSDTINALKWALDILDDNHSSEKEWIEAKTTLNQLKLREALIVGRVTESISEKRGNLFSIAEEAIQDDNLGNI